ncbi:hypothetical protein HK099_008118 [Clydaea vesicula]|uniref:Serine hydrolase domain-containing protein n=1 Tax=Clydaea vesicula TaxID=447962 RepID=A0AAD5U4W4_9FUNG|nr:hypothetical protein HK099_008118 [Clydaea vesicula]KAJ3392234.1 hypothetical protein HDU92_008587 [Lobulomyces angularis]
MSGLSFNLKTKALQKHLRKKFKPEVIEFTFINGPIKIIDEESDGEEVFTWLNRAVTSEHDTEVVRLSGYQFTFDYLDQIIVKEGPFDGIFGFSQGSHIASVYLAYLQSNNSKTMEALKFFVAISGFYERRAQDYLDDTLVDLKKNLPIQIPSLHVYGKKDEVITMDLSEKLAENFLEKEKSIYIHNGGHLTPCDSASLKHFTNFLCKFTCQSECIPKKNNE